MSAKAFVAEQHCFSPSLLHVSTYYVTPLVLSFSTIDNSFWSVGVCYKRAASCICFLPFPDADVRSINWYLNHFSGGEDRGQSSTRLLHFVISRSHDALIRFESGGLCWVSPGFSGLKVFAAAAMTTTSSISRRLSSCVRSPPRRRRPFHRRDKPIVALPHFSIYKHCFVYKLWFESVEFATWSVIWRGLFNIYCVGWERYLYRFIFGNGQLLTFACSRLADLGDYFFTSSDMIGI